MVDSYTLSSSLISDVRRVVREQIIRHGAQTTRFITETGGPQAHLHFLGNIKASHCPGADTLSDVSLHLVANLELTVWPVFNLVPLSYLFHYPFFSPYKTAQSHGGRGWICKSMQHPQQEIMIPPSTTGPINILDAATAIPKDMMAKLPTAINGPLAWSGADFEDEETYTWQLRREDVEEIDAALQSFKSLGLDGDQVDRDNFPLPNLAARLSQSARVIHEQRGFFVLRGLEESRYSVEDSTTIYLGISSYIADKRGLQDRKGNVLSHITNSKLWKVPVEMRHGIHSNQALPYHNDMGCDILALQVRHSAEKGGYTYLSSVSTAFNELLAEDPSAAKTLLTADWPVQISGRGAKCYLAPALAIHDGRLMASIDPNRFGPHPSSGPTNIPALTASQQSALERISKAAYRTELRLHLKTGDLLFFNNWALLHRRDSYTDGDDTSRHMVRLWLRNSKLGWAVPDSMLPPWYAAYGDNGVRTKLYPLIPMPDYKVPKYSAGSAAFMIEDSDASDDE